MRFESTVLSPAEKDRIHAASLKILAETGVKITTDPPLRLLEAHGAAVDWERRVARLPETLVAQALATTPRSFTLGARNPRYDFALPAAETAYSLDGTGAFVRDFASGERRYGRRTDIEQGVRVFQKMDMGVMAWPPTCASDAPANTRVLHEFLTMMRFCSKHAEHELHHPAEVPYFIAALTAILGSEEAIRQRKICSVTYCPVAPLVHEGPMCEAYLALGRYDVPVMVLPMPAAGTSGPASLYSSVCQANAEALSAITIFQCANPGQPIIFGSASGAVDFRTGGFLEGAPEMALQTAAMHAMGRYYGLPTASAGCLTDAKGPGPDALLEKALTTLPLVLAGVDLVQGIGEVEASQTLVLEQIVVDNEIAHLCRRMRQGVDSSPEKDFNADIAHYGPGGSFLGARNTLKATRSGEFYYPRLFDRNPFEAWVELGRPDVYTKARQIVDDILAAPLEDAWPEAVAQQVDDILAVAERELLAEE